MLGDPSGLTDTIFDLIVDALGGRFVSVAGCLSRFAGLAASRCGSDEFLVKLLMFGL